MLSDAETKQIVARMRKEMNDELRTEMLRVNGQIRSLQTVNNSTALDTSSRPLMENMTRNGDLRFSVDQYYNWISLADNSRYEAAHIYCYPPIAPIKIADAKINAGTNVFQALTSTPFTAGMVGRYVIIEGAGPGGAKFGARINTYNNSGEVLLSANAVTTVNNVAARINLQKLAHRNTKTSGDAVNDALKTAAHTNYGINLQDPDWQQLNGIGRIGQKNVVGFAFGNLINNGTTYVPVHQLFSGRVVFARLNLARANKFVKIKGKIFFALYNNHELSLDWVRSNQEFTISATVLGNPATTVTAKYLVVIETGSGFSLVSNLLTVPNAPTAAALAAGAAVRLNWTRYAGAVRTTIYRQFGAGDVYKVESDVFEREYVDVGNPTAQNIGAAFPAPADAENKVASFVASIVSSLPDNSAGEPFLPIEVFLPFYPSVNMAELFDPHLIFGLTEPLATEVTDAEANGVGGILSVSGAFTAAMVGKTYTLKKGNLTANGTVTGYTSPTQITLSNSPFAASGCTLEILDSQPNGLLFDLVGTALTERSCDWAAHPDDNNAQQASTSNPNGSTQGGIDGSDGYGGGYFGDSRDLFV